jgi:hypothetical protein
MANDPPFATLNHVAGDLGIPSESALLRIGISCADTLSGVWLFASAEWLVRGIRLPSIGPIASA